VDRRAVGAAQRFPRRRGRAPRGLDLVAPPRDRPRAGGGHRRQALGGRRRVTGDAQRDPPGVGDGIQVEGDHARAARKCLAEAQRVVERLAEEQHDVGLAEQPRGAVQPGVVDAARALDRQRRRADRARQALDRRPSRTTAHRRARQDQRALGLGQQRDDGQRVSLAECGQHALPARR